MMFGAAFFFLYRYHKNGFLFQKILYLKKDYVILKIVDYRYLYIIKRIGIWSESSGKGKQGRKT